MNDLEQFRAALRSPDPSLRPLDITSIMRAGTRVRRRRRLLVGAGSGLAVLALLVGGNVLVRVAQPAAPPSAGARVGGAAAPASVPPSASRPAPPPAPASESASESTSPPANKPTSSPVGRDPADDVLGEILPTDQMTDDGRWVIYMVRIDSANLPNTTIGIQANRLLPSGTMVGGHRSNETEGSDRAEGFHATSGSQSYNGVDVPAFGYYVGPAAKITAEVDGRTVQATSRRWSEDRNVVIFWFDLESVGPGTELARLAAYDDEGRKLPTGRATVAVG